MFIAALFGIGKTNPDVPQWWMAKQNIVQLYHGLLIINKREQTISTCNNLDEFLQNYAEKEKTQSHKVTSCIILLTALKW